MYRHNSGRVISYLTVCAQIEHFLEYRKLVRKQIDRQLAAHIAEEKDPIPPAPAATRSVSDAIAVAAP